MLNLKEQLINFIGNNWTAGGTIERKNFYVKGKLIKPSRVSRELRTMSSDLNPNRELDKSKVGGYVSYKVKANNQITMF